MGDYYAGLYRLYLYIFKILLTRDIGCQLLFVPSTPKLRGASMDILDIESMKAIESDLKVWFFYAQLKNVRLLLYGYFISV